MAFSGTGFSAPGVVMEGGGRSTTLLKHLELRVDMAKHRHDRALLAITDEVARDAREPRPRHWLPVAEDDGVPKAAVLQAGNPPSDLAAGRLSSSVIGVQHVIGWLHLLKCSRRRHLGVIEPIEPRIVLLRKH